MPPFTTAISFICLFVAQKVVNSPSPHSVFANDLCLKPNIVVDAKHLHNKKVASDTHALHNVAVKLAVAVVGRDVENFLLMMLLFPFALCVMEGTRSVFSFFVVHLELKRVFKKGMLHVCLCEKGTAFGNTRKVGLSTKVARQCRREEDSWKRGKKSVKGKKGYTVGDSGNAL